MAEERENEPFPREDARDTGMGDQMPEKSPVETTPLDDEDDAASQGPESDAGGARGPDTSRDRGPEGDPARATGNPYAAGAEPPETP